VADWPGEYRRRPPISSPTYAVRAPLAAWLREEAARRPRPYRVLDVGCGVKPYYPFFEPHASEYVGVDVVENPAADLQGAVESLPVEDASFDLVLCIQVLEHAEDPA
jgi:SAM-dependent methyltransferase